MKGRLRRRFVVTGIVVLMVVTAGVAYAAFSIVTSNTGTSLSADQLAPPSNLMASASCTASGAVAFRNSSSAAGTSGALTISKPAGVHSGSTGVSSTPTAPSVTTSVNSGFLVTFFVARQQSLAIGVGASDEPRPTAGATGTRAASIGSSFDWTGQSVAIKPAGAAQASLSWTASASTFASGYKLQRWLGAVQQNEQTVTPVSQTSGGDGPLASSTNYTYKITSFFGT